MRRHPAFQLAIVRFVVRIELVLLLIATVIFVGSEQCSADTLFLKDGSVLYGRVADENEATVKFQVRIDVASAGATVKAKYRERTVNRNEIVSIARTVKASQLTPLSPEDPRSYRDLAEQAAKQRPDPESRDLAVRLFLLAAYYAEPENDARLQSHCFRQLIQLARNEDERKRFQALAHIKVPSAQNWLTEIDTSANNHSQANQIDSPGMTELEGHTQQQRSRKNKLLLEAVRLIRTGASDEASSIVNQPWARESMNQFAETCDWFQLREIITTRHLSVEQLATLVELEVRLVDETTERETVEKDQPNLTSWSMLLSRKIDSTTAAMYSVGFENVSEFNLSKSIFRDGQWISPSKGLKGAR